MSMSLSASMHLTLLALFVHVGYCISLPASKGKPLRSVPHKTGISLLQRWAKAPSHDLELSSSDLTTYIATGKLPEQALAQLQAHSTEDRDGDPNGDSQASASDKAAQDKYISQGKKTLGEMKDYKQKLDVIRNQAEYAFRKVSEQEGRLSENFIPVSKLLGSLIQKAADAASKAEVRTMLNRLTRLHYKQVGALDRSAAYWMEVAEREAEARRVAEAERVIRTKVGFTAAEAQKLYELNTARNQDKAEMDAWWKTYWNQLEEREKTALESNLPFSPDEQKQMLDMLAKYGSTKDADKKSATKDADKKSATKG